MAKLFYLTCLAEKPEKSRIAKTLWVLATVNSVACSIMGKLLNCFFFKFMINVGLFSSLCTSTTIVFTEMSLTYKFTSVDFTYSS